MKKILFLLLLLPLMVSAQTYKYIGVEDGLSNRRVYYIQKDKKGYMWFLTHEGVDRYDGKEFKRYKLMDNGEELNSLLNLNWLYLDHENTLWEIGKKGKVFRYDPLRDEFTLVYKLPEDVVKDRPAPISYSFIDKNNNIWLCNDEYLYLYNTHTQQTLQIRNEIEEDITDIEQIDETHFFIGTEQGIHHAELKNRALHLLPCDKLDNLPIQINELYFHRPSRKLFIGTFERGIYVYDMNTKRSTQPRMSLTDVSITRIKPLNNKELLVATDGAGVYKINVNSYQTTPYIVADYNQHNEMNGNNIPDFYVDDEQRIWLANYPIGITVRNNRYSGYNWIKHSIGNKQSLINDQVNSIIEDSDGDLWYGTNNGISYYNSANGTWHSFMSSFEKDERNKNHIFLTVCEVEPGIIWAAGYSSGIYQINKRTLSVEYVTPSSLYGINIQPDKYIRSIMKTANGDIWSGGYYNLKRINFKNRTLRLYPRLNSITSIIEKDSKQMWIGTATGLYLLEKESGKYQRIDLPVESMYIYSLYQAKNGLLYIGTSGSGLLIYDPEKRSFTHYHKDNCALISNNIYAILSDADEDIVMSTENGLTSYYPAEKLFHNWTKDQGLMASHFNAGAGTLRKNGNFIFGSSDGAIEFNRTMKIPRKYYSKMVLSDLKIFYQTVYPGEESSPLNMDIDDTKELKLSYSQNIFSLKVSSINYDYPSNILYSWKLEGFYDQWSRPGNENIIRFTNLSPGEYTLHIRAVSNEDKRVVLEERTMEISIAQPIWLSFWAMLIYAVVLAVIAIIALRMIILRKQRKISDEKIHFFINTAHDIRTPLTLIKAPLEEIREREALTKDGISNMNTALRNVNALLRLTTNLINFERADVYSSELYISEYELNTYLTETFNAFRPYATVKHINFTYESNFRYLNVWIDKEKMDSILKNIISNALKYTPAGGRINVNFDIVSGEDAVQAVKIEVINTGQIPDDKLEKIFERFYQAPSNGFNGSIGFGIGLNLCRMIVKLHHGTINACNRQDAQGSRFIIHIPYGKDHLKKSEWVDAENKTTSRVPSVLGLSQESEEETAKTRNHKANYRIVIVDDDDEILRFLEAELSSQYKVYICRNGKEGLQTILKQQPDLIISDVVMPEMDGISLLKTIRNNPNVSHIPFILLTSKAEYKDRIEGLSKGADAYLGKPFVVEELRVHIKNLIETRLLLKGKFSGVRDQVGKIEIAENKSGDERLMERVMNVMNKFLDDSEFNVEMLAREVGLSRVQLHRKMKDITGVSTSVFIRNLRMKKAAALLQEGKLNISEIADAVGFDSQANFATVFKKFYGVSPSEYAASIRNKGE